MKATLLVASFLCLYHFGDVRADELTIAPKDIIVDPETKTVKYKLLEESASQLNVEAKLRPGLVAAYVIGHEDIYTWACKQMEAPAQLLDEDGGTIRLILQHELDGGDQLRMIDEHIALEWSDDRYGKRGRHPGRYGWTRQGGGGDFAWILGDQTPHLIANPWEWIWIDDFARFGNNAVLGGNKIQICPHPHVTARVLFYD